MIKLSQGWCGHLLALVAGGLVTLSLAPFGLWPMGIVSTALLAWLLSDVTPSGAVKKGWFYGFGLFGTGSSWIYVSIHVYGYAAVPLAAFLTLLWSIGLGLLASLTSYIYVRWIRHTPNGRTLGFAAIFLLGEWLRNWLLTGFPWLYLGYAHLDSPLSGWAPVGGVFALSFIVVYTGATISFMLQKQQLIPVHIAAILLLWLSGGLLQQVSWVSPTDQPAVKVAMVQANIPQEIKWRRDQYWPTLNSYQKLSQPLWLEHDIIIWPEAAVPGYYQNAKEYLTTLADVASSHNASLVTGIPVIKPATSNSPQQVLNSIMAFGEGSGSYHKQKLVPFGEFVPLESLLRGLIQFFNLPMSAFSAGPANQPPLVVGNLTLAPFICYEIVYPELLSQWLPDADLLVTISNDAWFGSSIGPLQHLEMAQMRALESGRYLLRSTGSGVSAIIDQKGRITVRSQQFTREVISGEAHVFTGSTPFSRFGSWPILLLCGLISIRLLLNTVKMRS